MKEFSSLYRLLKYYSVQTGTMIINLQIGGYPMKKHLSMILLAIMLCTALLCTGASANSWGLTGKLYQAVEQSKAWDNYSALSNQDGPFAVMKARYHNALFFVDNQGKLHVYTTAVYQPDEKKKAPSLFLDGDMLHLSYGDQEKYVFKAIDEDGEYQLLSAEIRSFQIIGNYDDADMHIVSYWANEENDTALWPVTVRLADFNINLLPHSVDEVRAQNHLLAQFDSDRQCLGFADGSGNNYSPDQPGELLQPKKKGTAPVYSAPYGKSAWRAGKGKAAVGLNGDMWLLSRYKNEDGKSYACIRYNVSERTQRIGYALCKELGLQEITDWNPDEPLTGFTHVDLEAAVDTYLTDDPDVSQFRQFTVPRGTQFSCMGLYNNHYAYVSAEVKNGKFVDGGAIVWGFVPVRDLKLMDQEKVQEAADRLIGMWRLEAGGSLADDYLTFCEDGTFVGNSVDWETGAVLQDDNSGKSAGTWYVTKYNPFMNLYWNKPPYQLTLICNNGTVIMRGLEITGEGFSLTNDEGGGGYVPATEEDVGSSDDHG